MFAWSFVQRELSHNKADSQRQPLHSLFKSAFSLRPFLPVLSKTFLFEITANQF